MKQKVLVRGPVLSQSGYGEQARFALRALRTREDIFDIFIEPISWGKTGWISLKNDERHWIDEKIRNAHIHKQDGGVYDISIQVTIPNEFEKLARINIGYTAGIETNRVAPLWIQKVNEMDKIIVVSNHSKEVFENTAYHAQHPTTGQEFSLRTSVPIDAVNYPVLNIDKKDIELELDYGFNYLAISQWGPRKNFENLINWFIEENYDQEVGLVVKTSVLNNSTMDREITTNKLKNLISSHGDMKCKIYLIHGDLSPEELSGLYNHSKIKCLISTTHGEGYGLPLFEAAYNGLPVIVHGWSGQKDFLYIPDKRKNGKTKPMFATVEYELKDVQKNAIWKDVIEEGSQWAYPKEASFKRRIREVRKNYSFFLKKAKKLQEHLNKNFTEEKKYEEFISSMGFTEAEIDSDYIFVSDLFANQLVGGAELSLEALFQSTPSGKKSVRINSSQLSHKILQLNKSKTWIFGNVSHLSNELLENISENLENYYFIEYDYKFCEYRNPILYQFLEDRTCNYSDTDRGRIITKFVNNSKRSFFMSRGQLDIYEESLPELDVSKATILSSTFGDHFFEKIEKYSKNVKNKNNKWIVLGSRSWVKGTEKSEKWCRENNLDYEVVAGLTPEEVIEKLSFAKGVSFLPAGYDTCPRFVIEAKLLGCKLHLNEYVQHANEPWFDTDDTDSIIKYLRGRSEFFWSTIE